MRATLVGKYLRYERIGKAKQGHNKGFFKQTNDTRDARLSVVVLSGNV
jgi:hypothetical protein